MPVGINKLIELLAPAKNTQCGIRAINCGADAVYIAAEQFGARKGVGNPVDDIARLVVYAHRYRAKVYVTINTILTDSELEAARSLIFTLYDIGVDAIIVQDMGLLEIDLPPIALFASTQAHNNLPEKVKFLEDVGFQRAILARELSLDEIQKIRNSTSIELECFVHGALCVSFSGQCYMSYAIGGRSGNRGECAQPCRKKYSLLDNQGKAIVSDKYLISLRELNLSDNIAELINAGITSFKIEGRLRDEAYITNIVSFYRQKIDTVCSEQKCSRTSVGRSIIDFNPDPAKTFNRGFTTYFLNGRHDEITSPDTPKSIGEPIGTVSITTKNSFVIDSDIQLHNGDGICFFNEKRELTGTKINRVEGNTLYPANMNGILKELMIYRNYDHQFVSHIVKADVKRAIDVAFALGYENGVLSVSAQDEEGIKIEEKYPVSGDLARNQQSALDTVRKQFAKLGDTEFICRNVDIAMHKIVFIPVGQLNEIRRSIIEKLRIEREKRNVRQEYFISKNNIPYISNVLSFEGNVLNRKAESFYKRHGVEKIEQAAESGVDLHDRKVMTTKLCLKYELGLCRRYKADKITRSVKEPLYLVDETGKHYKLHFDCDACVMEIFF